MIYIYTLNDPITGIPKYVGKTIQNPKRRYSQHISSELIYKNKKANWIKSLKNKGLKPILNIIEIIENINWEEREIYWINYFRNLGIDIKNMTQGGDGGLGLKQSKETIEKRVSKYRGKPRPDWVKQKISESHKGKKLSENTKRKLREINLGKIHSEESKLKKSKTVLMLNENNDFIKEYKSLTEAANSNNCRKGNLCNAIKNRKLYRGFKWIYKNQDIV